MQKNPSQEDIDALYLLLGTRLLDTNSRFGFAGILATVPREDTLKALKTSFGKDLIDASLKDHSVQELLFEAILKPVSLQSSEKHIRTFQALITNGNSLPESTRPSSLPRSSSAPGWEQCT